MSEEENKAVIRRFWDELNKGNLKVMDEFFADNFVNYRIDGKVMDKKDYKELNTMLLNAFPDIHATIGDVVAEGDKVALYFTLSGTQKGEFRGNPPTGKRFTISEAYFARFEGSKIAEFRNFQTQRQDE